jgi:hypothetical protein
MLSAKRAEFSCVGWRQIEGRSNGESLASGLVVTEFRYRLAKAQVTATHHYEAAINSANSFINACNRSIERVRRRVYFFGATNTATNNTTNLFSWRKPVRLGERNPDYPPHQRW